MEIKYLGDDGKYYNSEKEAVEADEAFKAAKEKTVNEKALISKAKKEASDKVRESDSKVKQAEAEYIRAKEEANNLIKEANLKAKELLKNALSKVDKARKEKMLAIQAFNEKFGAYEVRYTGAQAMEEYNRIISEMRKEFGNIFPFWF